MTDFAGRQIDFPDYILPANRSANLTAATDPYVPNLSVSVQTDFIAASRGVPRPPVFVAHRNVAGRIREIFGGELFEKIIVIPRVKALGFVLTATQFSVEVWNTRRNKSDTLTAINITGSGGLILTDPFGEPLLYAALDSYIYQATIPSAGAAQIDQDVIFVFDSGIPGTDMHVLGSRITLFSVAPDWSDGMEETIEFLTDVLVAYSDNEQRRGLRSIPRRAMRYRALTLNARDAAGMESLVWGWQNQPYGVPWWPDAQPLGADTASGSFVIPVDTRDRNFAEGGLLCIWQSEFVFEALSIDSVTDSSVTVTSPTQFSWQGGPKTRIMPVFLCRLPSKVDISRYSSEIDQLDVAFVGESQQPAPMPAISLPQFHGFDVLEIQPNWAEAPLKRTYARSLVIIDPKIGPITAVDQGGTAIVGQEFPWWLDGHANITTFRAFILARFGRLNPFWIPTWDQDLVLAADLGSSNGSMLIKSEFYARFYFPTVARRYIAFIPIDGSGNVYRKVTAATDNGDGTETLTLDSPTGKDFAKNATMVSFLTLARLADDKVSIKWDSTEHAEALLSLQELPRELP